MSWQGNSNNTPPNKIQQDSGLSEIKSDVNRALNTRRDTDTVKNVGISLLDIDTTIITHLNEEINPHIIVDGNSRIKVPIVYGSPERWKSARVDGLYRDYNGKIQLPMLMIKRSSVTKNENLMTLNRHLVYPVMTKYTEKNKYDKFSILTKSAVPVSAVHMITLPDHVKMTYNFMVWTELVEQMNMVMEKINFSTEDYWGDLSRYRFRVSAGDYTSNIDVSTGKDRAVRCEFSLTVMGYLLPDSFEDRQLTHRKVLTPRKVVVTENVSEVPYTQNVINNSTSAILNDGYIQLDEEVVDLEKSKISFASDQSEDPNV